jgi:hypothetical protein
MQHTITYEKHPTNKGCLRVVCSCGIKPLDVLNKTDALRITDVHLKAVAIKESGAHGQTTYTRSCATCS